MTRARVSRERGFALVEALASLAVIGMVALMLAAGATTGRRVWEGIDSRETTQESLENAQTAIRDRLEQTYAGVQYLGNPPALDFTGTADTLKFIANPPQAQRPGPLRRYILYLDAGGDLILASVSDVAPEKSAPERQVLLQGVRAIEIGYFGSLSSVKQDQWRASWRDQPRLPDLVRIRLAFEPGDRRDWPELTVAPRATIDTACLLNTLTHRCKGRA